MLYDSGVWVKCAVLLGLLTGGRGYACSCGEPPDPRTLFVGTVTSFVYRNDYPPDRYRWGSYREACFDVSSTEKGVHQSHRCVFTGNHPGNCGYEFVVGRTYRVALDPRSEVGDETPWVSVCSRTEDLSTRNSFFFSVVISLMAALLAVILLFTRRLRPRPKRGQAGF